MSDSGNSSVLDRIRRTLGTMTGAGWEQMQDVYYGACTRADPRGEAVWNYYVFNRLRTTKNNQSRMDFQTFYQIHIVHEDYIPEGFVERVIEELCKKDESGTKLRPTNDDIIYNYDFKNGTRMVVEIATITLFHPEKRA